MIFRQSLRRLPQKNGKSFCGIGFARGGGKASGGNDPADLALCDFRSRKNIPRWERRRSGSISPPVFPRPRDTSTFSGDAGGIRRIPRNSPPDIPLAQGPDPAAARIDRHETTLSPSVFHGYGELALHRQIGRELFRGRPLGKRDSGFHPPALAEAVTGRRPTGTGCTICRRNSRTDISGWPLKSR